ncbi:hypothetical protein AVEN_36291-1 [Araneus ventricosus]|uniref:Uncharacterized protein n=1 Tax=Araneus ventricosus TaxID=182803 RepID=A0A4Y2QF95_ARAVE|nr:hypothetical protein AVEN_183104-1 [Araneus ventricosus]GBN62240.1 hypothetical protein AVEN_75347-1 [Araneus ventricosus]GBN62403.1 hypothetical protein AVEN_106059-1 [Araneus ventricosus]GBN62434.1 hypothetical protein AVEN_36291-1 [Araneus ventricosus]
MLEQRFNHLPYGTRFISYISQKVPPLQKQQLQCGAVGSPIHYATECPLTLSWHMTQSSSDNVNIWRKSVAANKLFSQKICNIVQFIHKNNDLFKID